MKDPQFHFPNLSVLTFSTTHPEDFQLSPENVFILVILRPNQVIFLCCRDWKSSVLEGIEILMENLHFFISGSDVILLYCIVDLLQLLKDSIDGCYQLFWVHVACCMLHQAI